MIQKQKHSEQRTLGPLVFEHLTLRQHGSILTQLLDSVRQGRGGEERGAAQNCPLPGSWRHTRLWLQTLEEARGAAPSGSTAASADAGREQRGSGSRLRAPRGAEVLHPTFRGPPRPAHLQLHHPRHREGRLCSRGRRKEDRERRLLSGKLKTTRGDFSPARQPCVLSCPGQEGGLLFAAGDHRPGDGLAEAEKCQQGLRP